jgi:hypothetical protein
MTTAADVLTIAEIRRSLTRPVDRSTIRRWAARGLRTPDGRRVRLAAERLGGRLVVTREALDAFLAALNPDRERTGGAVMRLSYPADAGLHASCP